MDRANLESEIVRTISAAITMELKNSRPSLATTEDLKLTENRLRTEITDVKAELKELAQRVENGFAAIRLELERHKAEMARWMLAAFFTMFGLALGATYFMLNHFVQFLR